MLRSCAAIVNMGYLILATLVILSFVTYGNAVQCWSCSSDLDPHCGDPFNYTSPTFSLHHTLTNCDTQSNPNYLYTVKSVCKKAVKTEYGRKVISRSCEWLRSRDDQVGECSPNTFNTPSYSKVEFCETCDTEGCNGADGLSKAIWTAFIPICVALFTQY